MGPPLLKGGIPAGQTPDLPLGSFPCACRLVPWVGFRILALMPISLLDIDTSVGIGAQSLCPGPTSSVGGQHLGPVPPVETSFSSLPGARSPPPFPDHVFDPRPSLVQSLWQLPCVSRLRSGSDMATGAMHLCRAGWLLLGILRAADARTLHSWARIKDRQGSGTGTSVPG